MVIRPEIEPTIGTVSLGVLAHDSKRVVIRIAANRSRKDECKTGLNRQQESAFMVYSAEIEKIETFRRC